MLLFLILFVNVPFPKTINNDLLLTDLLLVKDSSDRSLYIKFMDTASGRRSFTYAAPRLWNRLPAATRKEENSEHFKKLIKTALFRNTNNIMQAVNLYNV